MKKLVMVLLAIFLLVFLVACQKGSGQAYRLGDAPVKSEETAYKLQPSLPAQTDCAKLSVEHRIMLSQINELKTEKEDLQNLFTAMANSPTLTSECKECLLRCLVEFIPLRCVVNVCYAKDGPC